jgi:hypothetical protein
MNATGPAGQPELAAILQQQSQNGDNGSAHPQQRSIASAGRQILQAPLPPSKVSNTRAKDHFMNEMMVAAARSEENAMFEQYM